MNKHYNFFSDAGHGWLQVPESEVIDLGLAKSISRFSYIDVLTRELYLEEDQDLALFLDARAKAGHAKPLITEINKFTGDSYIRSLDRVGA